MFTCTNYCSDTLHCIQNEKKDISDFSCLPACILSMLRLGGNPEELEGHMGGGTLKDGRQLADRAKTADHIHKDATDRYAPCLQALLLFARPIKNIRPY